MMKKFIKDYSIEISTINHNSNSYYILRTFVLLFLLRFLLTILNCIFMLVYEKGVKYVKN